MFQTSSSLCLYSVIPNQVFLICFLEAIWYPSESSHFVLVSYTTFFGSSCRNLGSIVSGSIRCPLTIQKAYMLPWIRDSSTSSFVLYCHSSVCPGPFWVCFLLCNSVYILWEVRHFPIRMYHALVCKNNSIVGLETNCPLFNLIMLKDLCSGSCSEKNLYQQHLSLWGIINCKYVFTLVQFSYLYQKIHNQLTAWTFL